MGIQMNTVFPLGTASLAQLAASQAGFLASQSSYVCTSNKFITPSNEFAAMTKGFKASGATRLFAKPWQGAKSPSLLRIMATAALLTCVGCAKSNLVPPNVGHTSYPTTNTASPTGIIFRAGEPLRRYEDGVIISGILATDVTVGGFTIKADSEAALDRSGRVVSAKPNQDIIIPVSPILEKIQDSIFENLIFNYELDVLREGLRRKMTVKELIEMVLSQGGKLTIPAGSIRMFFDEDGEIDEAAFLVEELPINEQLKVLVKDTKINLLEKLTPFFPRS